MVTKKKKTIRKKKGVAKKKQAKTKPVNGKKEKKEEEAAKGIVGGVWSFLKNLEDMDKKGAKKGKGQGKIDVPFVPKINYSYKVKIGKGFQTGENEVRRNPYAKPHWKKTKKKRGKK